MKQILKLCGWSILSTLCFALFASALSYFEIFILDLHTLSQDQEWATFQTALEIGILGYLGLYVLGLVMSWSRAKGLIGAKALGHAVIVAFLCAVVVALDALPRAVMEFASFLIPVAIPVISFYSVRFFSNPAAVA